MFCNSNSLAANGNSAFCPADDAKVRSLLWLFRIQVPGYVTGWPA